MRCEIMRSNEMGKRNEVFGITTPEDVWRAFKAGYREEREKPLSYHMALNTIYPNTDTLHLTRTLNRGGLAALSDVSEAYDIGKVAANAMSDLEYLGQPDAYDKGRANNASIFRRASRALYELGNLHTSKKAKTLVDKALENIEKHEDRFEYGLCKHLIEMMTESNKE